MFFIFFLFIFFFFVFFFQAEDGIRDPLVTGVQTCALPICAAGVGEPGPVARGADARVRPPAAPGEAGVRRRARPDPLLRGVRAEPAGRARSEERRVGKECRSGGWAEG